MTNKLTHRHFKEGSRLPYPGERIVFCSCITDRKTERHFNETVSNEFCDASALGCRIRTPDHR